MSLKTALIDWFIKRSDFKDADTDEPCVEGSDNCEVCTYCICWRAVFVYSTVAFIVGWGVGFLL